MSGEDKSLPRKADGSFVFGADDLPRLSPITRLDEVFGRRPVKQIRPKLLDAFVAEQKMRGLENGTIHRSPSSAPYSTPQKREVLHAVPTYWPMLPEAPARKGFFERHEYRALFATLPDYLKPLLAVVYWTGVSRGRNSGLAMGTGGFLGRSASVESRRDKEQRRPHRTDDPPSLPRSIARIAPPAQPTFRGSASESTGGATSMRSGRSVVLGEIIVLRSISVVGSARRMLRRASGRSIARADRGRSRNQR